MKISKSRFIKQLFFLTSCFTGITSANSSDKFIQFSSDKLITGRTLWITNCKGCHAYGTADAPVPMNPEDWRSRVKKNKSVLYDHAINGYFGPDDTMMPERGGNPELTDQQVKLAVDYMLSLAIFYLDKQAKQDH